MNNTLCFCCSSNKGYAHCDDCKQHICKCCSAKGYMTNNIILCENCVKDIIFSIIQKRNNVYCWMKENINK